MRPLTMQEVQALFTRKELERSPIPNLENIDWEDLDYFHWFDKNDRYAMVVYQANTQLAGIVLEKNRNSNARSIAYMCDWCASPQDRAHIATFCYRGKRKAYSVMCHMLCSDLECSRYIRGLQKPSGLMYGDTSPVEKKIMRLRASVERFLDQVKGF